MSATVLAAAPLRSWRRILVLLLVTVLLETVVLVPARAYGGGDFVDLAVGNASVWFVGEAGVHELGRESAEDSRRI
jgi:hypothetical protein